METLHNEVETSTRKRVGIILIALISIGLIIFLVWRNYFMLDKKEGYAEAMTPNQQNDDKIEVIHPDRKVVYLTFDDGPSRLTEQFLDLLQEENIKATFFMQGEHLKKEYLQKSVKRATKEGHYIGAHSMTHAFELLYSENQFVPEMSETLMLIEDITGETPRLVRPPYGSAPGLEDEQIRDEIVEVGMKVWDWTIDSRDWELKDDPAQIIDNIKKETNLNVEVVLMHEKLQTLEVLPEIIEFFREQGYEFAVYEEDSHFELNFLNDIRL